MKIKLPKWLRKDVLQLPDWASVVDHNHDKVSICIEVDTDAAYREWLQLLNIAAANVDQYWLEVVYQCAKLDVQSALVGTEYDPRTAAQPAEFHFLRAPQWEIKKFPHGKGVAAASQGKEARGHYRTIRGKLPF